MTQLKWLGKGVVSLSEISDLYAWSLHGPDFFAIFFLEVIFNGTLFLFLRVSDVCCYQNARKNLNQELMPQLVHSLLLFTCLV